MRYAATAAAAYSDVISKHCVLDCGLLSMFRRSAYHLLLSRNILNSQSRSCVKFSRPGDFDKTCRHRYATATATAGAFLSIGFVISLSARASCEGKCEYEIKETQIFRQPSIAPTSKDNTKCSSNIDNKVLSISNVLSPEECKILIHGADELLNARGNYSRDLIDDDDDDDEEEDGEDEAADRSLRRVSLCDMSPQSQKLSNTIIFKRALPTLRRKNPQLLEDIGLSNFDSKSIDFAADEPSINRYEVGGKFDPHRDGYMLTIIILLSEEGAFEGGGTRFFDSVHTVDEYLDQKESNDGVGNGTSVLMKPAQGTALLFSGNLFHAGCPVENGVRHLFVASFSLRS